MRQPPLIETGSSLPSPIFQPRPGWGGKFNLWLREHFTGLLFWVLTLIASILATRWIVHSWTPPVALVVQSPTPTPGHDIHHQTARPGEGISTLAAHALDECLLEHPELGPLDPVQHLWAVDRLFRSVPQRILRTGDTIDFDHTVVTRMIQSAKNISPTTRHSLAPYLR